MKSRPSQATRARGGLSRVVDLLLRWPVGMALVSWRYLWRTTVLHRWEGEGGTVDYPPEVPPAVADDAIQHVTDGVGPLLHRRYRVRIRGTRCTPKQLMRRFVADLNAVVPSEVAFFRQLSGSEGPPQLGDEYVVRMPGPWDGPVRVVCTDAQSLRLATLRGHLEAGQIEFHTSCDDDALLFEIESWPGLVIGWRMWRTTTSAWPKKSSSTCGPIVACEPARLPAADRTAESSSLRTASPH